jgi:hypothetical protein
MNPVLRTAIEFHAAGVCVVPARIDGSKAPIGSWKQFQSERPTLEQITQWFATGHEGIGIITGAVSGNLLMVEFEGRAIADGLLEEAAGIANASGLEEIWRIITTGYVEKTPSGGLHLLWRIADEPVAGNTKLARRPGGNDTVEVLCETRGEGGFVITAPSSGSVHPSGEAWQLLVGSPALIPMLSAEENEAILTVFQALDKMPVKEEVVRDLVQHSQGDKPGDDFNNRAEWTDILKGWKKVFSANGVTYWRRPGKDTGISATTGRNDGDNLFVFTTSTLFQSETPYSKFAAFAVLNHNGDFSRAAADLRSQGYGKPNSNSSQLSPLDVSRMLEPLGLPGEKYEDWIPNQDEETESSWKPVELADYYDGLHETPNAEILKRTDGSGLIYKGRVHSFYGESESGKSWLAQIATAELLKDDKKVTYIDFESDAADVVGRLKGLGVTRANVLQYLTYIRPEGAWTPSDPYWEAICQPDSAHLVVIDGVTEALTMWGGETKDNDAITKWMRMFPRTISQNSGAAVVLIDHITKNAETRGRFAIGGQAKLATIDGSAFLVEPLEALSPGRVGTLTVRVTKDRPGYVRKNAGMYRKSDRTQEAAIITIDSTKPIMQYIIEVPRSEDEVELMVEKRKLTELVEFIHNNPGCNRRIIQAGVKGDKSVLGERIKNLVTNGWVENKGDDTKFILYVTADGKAEFNLLDAIVTHLDVIG